MSASPPPEPPSASSNGCVGGAWPPPPPCRDPHRPPPPPHDGEAEIASAARYVSSSSQQDRSRAEQTQRTSVPWTESRASAYLNEDDDWPAACDRRSLNTLALDALALDVPGAERRARLSVDLSLAGLQVPNTGRPAHSAQRAPEEKVATYLCYASDDSQGNGDHGATVSKNEGMGRPVGAPGRPFTQRSCRPKLEASMRPASQRTAAGGRRIEYVDHHHVHHHHHFHLPSDWGGPGDVPPEPERKELELRAEEDVERARGGAAPAHHAGGPGNACRKVSRRGQCGSSYGVRRFNRGTGRGASPRQGTARSGTRGNLFDTMTPDREFTAESLVNRDGGWQPGSTDMSLTSAPATAGTIAGSNAKQRLSLEQYLSLISQLPPQSRLHFSPYSTPHSARGISARGAHAADVWSTSGK